MEGKIQRNQFSDERVTSKAMGCINMLLLFPYYIVLVSYRCRSYFGVRSREIAMVSSRQNNCSRFCLAFILPLNRILHQLYNTVIISMTSRFLNIKQSHFFLFFFFDWFLFFFRRSLIYADHQSFRLKNHTTFAKNFIETFY